jgi:hypothetical protein
MGELGPLVGWAAIALCGGVLGACGNAHAGGQDGFTVDDSGAGTTDAAPAPETDSQSPGPVFSSDGALTDDTSDGCPESATLVYVTGESGDLWSFYPPTLKFTRIGPLTCLSSPTHMTVDRQANAWVVANGLLYKASTKNASCAAVPTWTMQNTFPDFALTFIGTTNAIDNTLYIMGESNLGKFDVSSGAVTVLGPAPTPFADGDMTSNGKGGLFFLLDQEMLVLYDVSPANGAVLSMATINATGGGDQALAYWGGDFYAFEDNVINQYDPSTKATKVLGTAPLSITGAGQSTCVPQVQPPTQ